MVCNRHHIQPDVNADDLALLENVRRNLRKLQRSLINQRNYGLSQNSATFNQQQELIEHADSILMQVMCTTVPLSEVGK